MLQKVGSYPLLEFNYILSTKKSKFVVKLAIKMIKQLTAFAVFFFFLAYYLIGFHTLIEQKTNPEFPYLRGRLGTIMWHSSNSSGYSGEFHTYCYYPKAETNYENKGGEYLIKRQDSGNCEGWYGKVIFYEGSWVSEREKIWWNKGQKILEDMLSEKKSELSI